MRHNLMHEVALEAMGISNKDRQTTIISAARDIVQESFEASKLPVDPTSDAFYRVMITAVQNVGHTYLQLKQGKTPGEDTPMARLVPSYKETFEPEVRKTRSPVNRETETLKPIEVKQEQISTSNPITVRGRTDQPPIVRLPFPFDEEIKDKPAPHRTHHRAPTLDLVTESLFSPRHDSEGDIEFRRRQAAQERLNQNTTGNKRTANTADMPTTGTYGTYGHGSPSTTTISMPRDPNHNRRETANNYNAVRFVDAPNIPQPTTHTPPAEYQPQPPPEPAPVPYRLRATSMPPFEQPANEEHDDDDNPGNSRTRRATQSDPRYRSATPNTKKREGTRGYSLARDIPIATAPGVGEAIKNHKEMMYTCIRDIINKYLSIPPPEGIKLNHLKLPQETIEPYGGSHRFSDLEKFITALCIDYELKGLSGPNPQLDRIRVLGLKYYLKGEAKNMIMRHVMSITRTQASWSFEEALFNLYDRFMQPTATHEAQKHLDALRYSPNHGIQAYYDKMVEYALAMSTYPDNMYMVKKFISGLPIHIRKNLIVQEGLQPEVNSIDEFVAYAVSYESRLQLDSYYDDGPDDYPRRSNPRVTLSNNQTRGTQGMSRNQNTPMQGTYTRKDNYNQRSKPFGNRNTTNNVGRNDHQSGDQPRKLTTNNSNQRPFGQKKEYTPYKPKDNSSWTKNNQYPKNKGNLLDRIGPKRAEMRAAHTEVSINEEEEFDRELAVEMAAMHDSDDDADNEHSAGEAGELSDDNEDMITDYEVEEDEYYEQDEESHYDEYRALSVVPSQAVRSRPKDNTVKMRKITLRKETKKKMRPQHKADEKQCLATFTKVGDVEAWTLWDSGSTMTGMTPTFAQIANIRVFELIDPHILQLGTVGSRSTLKYGTNVEIKMGNNNIKTYMDIANFDKYDMVIGTPFMRANSVLLDFTKNEVVVNGQQIPAVTLTAEAETRVRRHCVSEKVKE
ncbi:hypothetical protein NP233_g1560 [Leucocoprinus birnbaumii]|uniref:Retrotransposon gag domain-containing protein n=1 Tax=Leucocoprinus birnbaumii TaxID=56174 RepID=A0AAD5VZR3_9AGAR|nr:hypothetical protein NP233_g1560 [Leucocoprinus birnbaumii]